MYFLKTLDTINDFIGRIPNRYVRIWRNSATLHNMFLCATAIRYGKFSFNTYFLHILIKYKAM